MTDSRPTLPAIDDEQGMLALVKKLACDMKLRVPCHSEGRGALAHISRVRPDVVLVDRSRPETGWRKQDTGGAPSGHPPALLAPLD